MDKNNAELNAVKNEIPIDELEQVSGGLAGDSGLRGVECNICGGIVEFMRYVTVGTKKCGMYKCTNPECRRYNKEAIVDT